MKLAAEISSKTAEQRFDKLSNQLVKSAKHIYSEKATYHELTEGMRAWVLKKSDIKKKFHLNRTFFTHLNKGEHMLLSEFVRFTNWIFTHYASGGHLFQCPQEYGRGFGLTSIKNMRSFYLMFSNYKLVKQCLTNSNSQTNQFVKHRLTNLRYHSILTYHGFTMNAYCV